MNHLLSRLLCLSCSMPVWGQRMSFTTQTVKAHCGNVSVILGSINKKLLTCCQILHVTVGDTLGMHVVVEANIISYCWTQTRIPSTDTLSIIPSVFLPRMCSLFSSLETLVHNTIIWGLFSVPLRGLVSTRPASVRQRVRWEIAHRAEDAAGGQAHPVAIAAAVADAAWLSNRTLRGDFFFWKGGIVRMCCQHLMTSACQG